VTWQFELFQFMLDRKCSCIARHYAAFTLNGFDGQERNLTFVKADFQVFKRKFHACNFK